ncbi:MAG: RHS repeat protein [Lachnospiraceae bacterium]|nr:RHS repeat protein [Lachnospiraceae bacterium]MBQ7776979.1 RHS repeat protein [Lachnospiraceae bacterium]
MKKFGRVSLMVVVIALLIMENSICIHAEEYEYDALNRVIKVTYEDGSYVEYAYDANGNILSVDVYNANPAEEESGEADKPTQEGGESSEESGGESTEQPSEEEGGESTEQPPEGEGGESTEDSSQEGTEESTGNDNEEDGGEEEPSLLEQGINAVINFLNNLFQWFRSWFA